MLYDKEYVKCFQKAWSLEELKSMTLSQYSNGVTEYRNNFLYWVVFKRWAVDKDKMKEYFGVYKHIHRNYVSYYDWDRSLGKTEEEAFEKIKNEIIKVAQYSQKGRLDEIDNLKLLHFQFKWRIAFLYQNLDDTKMFGIFSEILQRIINGEEPETELLNLNLQKITKRDNMKTAQPLNQILYGPPGTGKTYNTINRALEILGEKVEGKDRAELKAKFDEYRQNGQIEFVTFHQSFSYEEFVEGIKPNTDNPENMIYESKDGIFKKMCDRALYKEYQFKSGKSEIQTDTKTRVWKISIVAKNEAKLRKEVLDYCFRNNEIRIGWGNNKTLEQISVLGRNDQSSIYQFENEADIGDIVCIFENANGDIKGIGIVESEFYWDDKVDNSESLKLYPRVRKVKWLSNKQINIRDLNGGIGLTLKTFYPLDRVNAIELLNRIGKLDKKDLVVDNTQKPFVLIIDEINRGNISKILGELITLIEPSKRIGASDEEKARGIGNESLEVTLPYSNKSFGVPSNLYIIGTMNTADRSIALLDTALRRRFEFVEMMPECEHKDISTECDGVNLQALLKTMNERIEFLLDREHTIGHSFFIGVDSLSELREVFKLKIIPLLQEYFYDDYAKIDAVLGGNGMIKSFSKEQLKVNLSDDFVDSDKKVYRITDSNIWKKENFQRIYDSSVKIDTDE